MTFLSKLRRIWHPSEETQEIRVKGHFRKSYNRTVPKKYKKKKKGNEERKQTDKHL